MTTLQSRIDTLRSLDVCGRQKYERRHYAPRCNAGISVPPIANHYRPDSRPYQQSLVRPFAYIYTLLPTNKLYILSCFLALLIIAGRSWNLICGQAHLSSFHVLMLMCHFMAHLLVDDGTLGPLMIVLSAVICRLPSVHVHLPCDQVGFPFLILRDVTLHVVLCYMSEVMSVFHFLE